MYVFMTRRNAIVRGLCTCTIRGVSDNITFNNVFGNAVLALLNSFVIHRDYAITNCSVVCLHRRCRRHHRRKLFVQTLSPLKFTDRLASNFFWGILRWVSTKVLENYADSAIFSNFFLIFFRPIFKHDLWSLWTDWLQIWISTKIMEIMLNEHFLHFFQFFLYFFMKSPIFKRSLLWSSWADWLQILCAAPWGRSVPRLWKLCRCSNLSAECQGPWVSCFQ